jgi:hypothetical protein
MKPMHWSMAGAFGIATVVLLYKVLTSDCDDCKPCLWIVAITCAVITAVNVWAYYTDKKFTD